MISVASQDMSPSLPPKKNSHGSPHSAMFLGSSNRKAAWCMRRYLLRCDPMVWKSDPRMVDLPPRCGHLNQKIWECGTCGRLPGRRRKLWNYVGTFWNCEWSVRLLQQALQLQRLTEKHRVLQNMMDSQTMMEICPKNADIINNSIWCIMIHHHDIYHHHDKHRSWDLSI